MLNVYLTISLTCSTYDKSYVNTYFNNLFNTFDSLLYLTHFSFAKQFGHDDWQGYWLFIHRWTKWYGIVNKAICGTKESATNADELEEYTHTLYLFLHWKATPQVIFTTVMRQLYSTNLFLIELIAVLMTSLLFLQNVKTG